MRKHAYLIIAHANFNQLSKLIEMIDHTRNDIFLHIDKKCKEFKYDDTKSKLNYSNIYLIENPVQVTWGGYSQIESELLLLEKATSIGNYQYYHLISGMDLPIKSQDYIHNFFDKNNGKEFVRFSDKAYKYYDRVRYYYFLGDKIGKPDNITKKILKMIEKLSLIIQKKILNIDRVKDTEFRKGTNWFSITDGLARLIISKKEWIRETFKYTFCCDEIFLQTIVYNSEYKDRLYWGKFDNDCRSIMRFIDWDRGCPYTFKIENYDELINSQFLWARKFDERIDDEIINAIQCKIKNNDEM